MIKESSKLIQRRQKSINLDLWDIKDKEIDTNLINQIFFLSLRRQDRKVIKTENKGFSFNPASGGHAFYFDNYQYLFRIN